MTFSPSFLGVTIKYIGRGPQYRGGGGREGGGGGEGGGGEGGERGAALCTVRKYNAYNAFSLQY